MKNFIIFILILIILGGAGYLIYQKYNISPSILTGPTDNLSNKNLNQLPKSVTNDINVITLDLSHNNLTSLPSEIGNLTKVEVLNVSYNNLTGALPAEIRKMTHLRDLNASNNQLTGIPAEIGQLKYLENVDFSNNNIDTMPNEIANLKDNLKVLNLKGNKYSQSTIADIQAKLPNTQVIF